MEMRSGRIFTHSKNHCALNNSFNRDANLAKTMLHVLNDCYIALEQVDRASQRPDVADNRLGHVVLMSTA